MGWVGCRCLPLRVPRPPTHMSPKTWLLPISGSLGGSRRSVEVERGEEEDGGRPPKSLELAHVGADGRVGKIERQHPSLRSATRPAVKKACQSHPVSPENPNLSLLRHASQ